MERENSNRIRKISLRLTTAEYMKIERKWRASTCRKLSDYIRHCLFERPVTSTYRNQSMDDVMAEMGRLRGELNHLGNNFNQAVKRLHTLTQIAEFRSWMIGYEIEKKTLFNKVEEIKKQMQKIAESWLQ
ncbi:MAG: hypothetical protein WC384_19895 [Prolixibacteraceae bacterium]|jgi:hypothetical protein